MIKSVTTVDAMSKRELLAKAKELQAPRSFATGALAGLSLYLHDCKDEEVLEMLREGIKFCDLCQRDLEAYQPEAKYRFSPGKGPRYYRPSDIVPSPERILELRARVKSIKVTLNSILGEEQVPKERIKECHSFIKELLQPYREQAAVSLGQFKYGPTLRK